MPKFNGNYSDWLEIRDTYESLIHKNDSIDDMQKFHYLRASLEGSRGPPWDALLERYDNTKILVHNHIKATFSIESVNKVSASALRNISDVTSKNMRALEQLEQQTDN